MRPKALIICEHAHFNDIYGPEELAALGAMLDFAVPYQDRESVERNPEILRDVEVILGSWGMPVLNETFLAHAPVLKAVFYASGTVKNFVTDAFWDRGLILSGANSVFVTPVAEFTVSQIIFCLKHGWQFILDVKRNRTFRHDRLLTGPGCFHTTVGLISMGATARHVLEKLRAFDFHVIAYDPFLTNDEAHEMGITLRSLDEVFAEADVVSLHSPNLPETRAMIKGHHFEMMKQGASFINTARGAIIDEPAMIKVLQKRTDIVAVLDVTFPEPPPTDSPLYDMDNVILTPHIAGVMGPECRRGSQMVAQEVRRWLAREPLCGSFTKELLARSA